MTKPAKYLGYKAEPKEDHVHVEVYTSKGVRNIMINSITDPKDIFKIIKTHLPELDYSDMTTPLSLQLGKRYVRRDGKITHQLVEHRKFTEFPFKDPATNYTYKPNGYYQEDEEEDSFDLIEEYIPPQPTPEQALSNNMDKLVAVSQPTSSPREKANEVQVGGDHYKSKAIEPWDYIISNNIGFLEGNAIKYITRHKEKNGVQDIDKAIHYLMKLKETLE
jgi:hypothetical protein